MEKKTTPVKILYPKNCITCFGIPTRLINIFGNKSRKDSFVEKLENIQVSTTLILKIAARCTFVRNVIELF